MNNNTKPLSVFDANGLPNLKMMTKQLIGFDNIFQDIMNHPSKDNYPPYNIIVVKNEDFDKMDYERMGGDGDKMIIEVACAGFYKNGLGVNLKDNLLTIRTECQWADQPENYEYQHKGIAERSFELTFRVANYVEVEKAKYENGILKVYLTRNIPDETYTEIEIE